ncbi:MAG: peptidoglycan-binding protein [Coprococcus sp. 43_8]|nr:MAG: peptidoglycan-binding protein [Coprococcus sp. 43_8]
MELIRKQVRMNQMGKTVTDQFMIGGDYNVPDAKSDVGRVLSGEGSLRIEETRRVENYLRVTGKLNFKVLYVTDSGDPRPGALEGMIPFEEMVYMEEENGEGEDIVQVQRVECGVSLIHSRKLAVKALAEMTVHTEQITEKQVTLDVDGEEGIYLKKCPVELLQLFTAKRDIYRIKEEIKIPGTKENAMLINGELQIFVLYESQEGKTDWVEQTVPYEGRIECAGAEEGMYHHVYDRLDDISVEVRMDEDGEMRALGIEAALQVRLFVYGEEKLEILEDAYSLDKKCVLETEEVVVEELLMQNHSKSKITERLSLPELKDEILQVCHSSADLQIEKMEVQDGGILAEGILNVSFLYVKANDEVPFGVWKGMVPFSAMLECREGSSDMKYDVTYAVEQLAVDLAGNDEVEIKAVVAFRSFMRKAEKIQMVTEAALVDYEKEERMNQPGIVGYIVKDGDDLWSLAKKYLTTEESILLNNELLSKELKTGDKILIFRESLSIL